MFVYSAWAFVEFLAVNRWQHQADNKMLFINVVSLVVLFDTKLFKLSLFHK
jgi:hypothetical protein